MWTGVNRVFRSFFRTEREIINVRYYFKRVRNLWESYGRKIMTTKDLRSVYMCGRPRHRKKSKTQTDGGRCGRSVGRLARTKSMEKTRKSGESKKRDNRARAPYGGGICRTGHSRGSRCRRASGTVRATVADQRTTV